MPDTLTPEELAAIRERDGRLQISPRGGVIENNAQPGTGRMAMVDRRALLAHIDALTAAVRALPGYTDNLYGKEKSWVDLADVLAILGEPDGS